MCGNCVGSILDTDSTSEGCAGNADSDVEPVIKDDVEIFGEYVGRIRAQQFVEVRARVEGYLENMLFAEGTYVNKNQVLFVINQDQYRAKADKARAQLKKDEAQALKAET